MRSRALVDLPALWYGVARRLHVGTRALRQDRRHPIVPRPPSPTSTIVPTGGRRRPLRVLLLGNGPAESPGLEPGQPTFADRIASELSACTGAPVQVRTVIGAAWDLPALRDRLAAEQVHRCDALVVTASYRPRLAEVPIAAWRAYTAALRTALVEAAGPRTEIRVLGLDWQDAVARAPEQWGGSFGARILLLAETAESVLDDRRAVPLRLAAPAEAAEWHGPAFTGVTYAGWARQVAEELGPCLAPALAGARS